KQVVLRTSGYTAWRPRKRTGIRARGGTVETQRARNVADGRRPEARAVGTTQQQTFHRQPAQADLAGGLVEGIPQRGIADLRYQASSGVRIRTEHPVALDLPVVVVPARYGRFQTFQDGNEPLGIDGPVFPVCAYRNLAVVAADGIIERIGLGGESALRQTKLAPVDRILLIIIVGAQSQDGRTARQLEKVMLYAAVNV